jgi:hypothetical protein
VNPTDWLVAHVGLGPPIAAWLSAFSLTQLIEIPFYIRAFRGRNMDSPAAENPIHPIHPSTATPALATQIRTPHLPTQIRTPHLATQLALAFLPSALTHPLVWFAFPRLSLAYVPMVVCAELFAVGAEAALLHALRVPRALAWSLLANAASLTTGLALRALVGWP